MDKTGAGVLLVVGFLGIFGAMGFVETVQHNVDVQENVPTEAEVVDTDVEVQVDDDDEEYNPVVVYEYEVDGETYRSDNTYPGQFTRWHGSESTARDVVDDHPVGSDVTVYYRPDDPGTAYLTNDGWPDGTWMGAGYIVVAGLTGGWLIRKGFRRWRQRNLIETTPTEQVRSLSIGPSEIKGVVACGDRDPLPAPFTEDTCVLVDYEVKEYDTSGKNNTWKTRDSDTRFVPFSVDDGTGTVLVVPHEETVYDLDPDDWTEVYVDSSERGPERVRTFVEEHPDLEYPSDSSGKSNDRRYRQNLIRPGDDVYVFGTVHPREDEVEPGANQEDRLVVRKVDEDGALSEPMYMISDDRARNLKERRRFALWRVPVGGFLLVVAFVFSVGIFAPWLGLEVPAWV